MSSFEVPVHNRCGISGLVGTGSIAWSGLYVTVSTIGLVLSVGLVQIFYLDAFNITAWWYKGLLFVACMVSSPIIFGGAVVGLWHIWESKASEKELGGDDRQNSGIMQNNQPREQTERSEDYRATSNIVRYGCRPDFRGISSKHISKSYE